jgi:hypothetical protein
VAGALDELRAPLFELRAEIGFRGIEPEAQLDERLIEICQRLAQPRDPLFDFHQRSAQGIFPLREFLDDTSRESRDGALTRVTNEPFPAR